MANVNSTQEKIRLEVNSRGQLGISSEQAKIIGQRVAFLLIKKTPQSKDKLH